MFNKIKDYFKGSVHQKIDTHVYPIGRGTRVNVDAGGNMVFATCVEILAKNLAQMRWGLYGPDNSELNTILPLYRKALNLQPYPGVNAYDFGTIWKNSARAVMPTPILISKMAS